MSTIYCLQLLTILALSINSFFRGGGHISFKWSYIIFRGGGHISLNPSVPHSTQFKLCTVKYLNLKYGELQMHPKIQARKNGSHTRNSYKSTDIGCHMFYLLSWTAINLFSIIMHLSYDISFTFF